MGVCTSFHYLDRYPQSPSVDQPGKSKPSPNMRFSSLLTASMASVVAGQGLTQTLMDQPSLSNLTTYLNLFPTLLNELSSMSNITLLAPSNMAFETALNSSTGAAFTANNTDVISALFSYHVLNGTVGYSSMLTNGSTLTTMDGIPVTITIQDSEIFVNSARVVTQDVLVANGVMHVIDGVLNPGIDTSTCFQWCELCI